MTDPSGQPSSGGGPGHPPSRMTRADADARPAESGALFSEQNPSPVLRVSREGHLLYANAASAYLTAAWGRRPGEPVPENIRRLAEKALNTGQVIEVEVPCDTRIYSLHIAPIVSRNYVNLYGRDITHQRQADRERDNLLKRHVGLVRVAQQVLNTADVPDLLRKVVDAARELTESKLGMSGHSDGNSLRVVATSPDGDLTPAPPGTHFIISEAEDCLNFIYGNPSIRLTDAALRANQIPRPLPNGHIPLRGLLASRLIGPDDRPDGLIAVSDKTDGGEFTPGDEVALRQLANITALAVRLIKARDEAHNHARETLASAKALKESGARMRTMLDHMPIGVWFTDSEGAISYGNNAAKRIWAGARYVGIEDFHEYKGWWHDTGAPIKPEEWSVVRAVRKGETSLNEIIEILCFDGTRKIIRNSAVPILDETGRIDGSVIINEDISKQIAVENALRELNTHLEEEVKTRTEDLRNTVDQLRNEVIQRLEAEKEARDHARMLEGFFRHTITPLAFMDHRFNFIRVNESYAKADGKTPDDFVGGNHFDIYPHSENRAIFERVVRTKKPYQAFARPFTYAESPERGPTYWNWQLTPLLDESGGVLFLVLNLENVTEQERALRELAQRAKQLQELTLELSQAENRERKRLAGILHDDLQQQLAAIKFHLSVLGDRIDSNSSLRPMVARLDGMLVEAIGKSRSLSHELSPAVLYQNDLKEVFEWLGEQMEAKYGLAVRVETVGDVLLKEEALRAFLYKAAQEILFNIVKHAGVNRAVLRLRASRHRLQLIIADDGRGFDFGPSRKSPGFGIMSIRERIALLGGAMKIRSVPGKGSVIVITLRRPEGSS